MGTDTIFREKAPNDLITTEALWGTGPFAFKSLYIIPLITSNALNEVMP